MRTTQGLGPGAWDAGPAHHLAQGYLEDYSQGRLGRREALKRIAAVVGSLTAAEGLLAACQPAATPTPAPKAAAPTAAPAAATATPMEASAEGITIPPNDPAIAGESVEFPGQDATLLGYLARPAGDGKVPGVLICHENRGLLEHFKDVARRFAKEGYAALALDVLSRQSGTDQVSDPGSIPTLLREIPQEQIVQDFRDGMVYLQSQPFVRAERIGMIGYCFGGGITWRCATQIPELRAVAPYYGSNPPLDEVPQIKAAVLGIYAETDTRITSGVPDIEAALKAAGVTYKFIIYPGAAHAFFNDTGTRYHPEAAAGAWAETLAWYKTYLKD
ncbi:MAG: dienelactone hydrolase family protein [Anaerolineae bacterium]|nr:dienelactone hydrolase family protein [Anaerolineae bacterium]